MVGLSVSLCVSLSSVNYLILLNLSLSEAEIQLSVMALRALWELRLPAWAEHSGELSGLLVLLSEHPPPFSLSLFSVATSSQETAVQVSPGYFQESSAVGTRVATVYSWSMGSTVCSLYMGSTMYRWYTEVHG